MTDGQPEGDQLTEPLDDAPPRANPLLPAWMIGATEVGWRVLVLAGLALVAAQLALILSTAVLAILVGAFVAATFSPVVRVLRSRRGWSPGRAAAVASLLALVAVLVIVALVVLAFVPYADAVIQTMNLGSDGLADELGRSGLPGPLIDAINQAVSSFQTAAPDVGQSLVGSVGTLVTVLVLGGFLAFYLMQDADRAMAQATETLDTESADALAKHAATAALEVGAYLRANVLTAAASATTQAVYLSVLGVPYAGPLAVLVFVAAFVPYLGAIFTTVVLALVTFATVGALAMLVLLVLIALTAVVLRRVLDERVYRRAIRVHPALVLVIAPAGAALFGIVGLLLAVPVTAATIAIAPAVREVFGARAERLPGTVVPVWLDQMAQAGWRLLVVLGVVLVVGRTLVGPFLTAPVVVALVIACASKPGSDALRRRGLGPTTAALGVTVASAVVVVAVLALTIVSLATQLPAIVDEALRGGSQLLPPDLVAQVAGTVRPDLVGASQTVVTNGAAIFAALATAAILTFFFLRDGPVWWSALLHRAPAAHRDELGASGVAATRILNGATLGTGLVSAIAGVLQAVMMTILGLPLAIPIGVFTFFSGFIPYIGGFVATGIVVLVAVAVGGPSTVLFVAILTVFNNILIGNFVAPLVLGRTVHIHPAIVLMAAPVGAAIGGLVGLFLIVPSIAILQATWRPIVRLFLPDGVGARSSSRAPAPAAKPGSRRTSKGRRRAT